jgi:hypothetical protein
MRVLIYTIIILFGINAKAQNVTITEMSSMPKAISNNAVTEGFINGNPYVFSFGGIDSSKSHSGITNESYRYDVINDSWDTIAPLPSSTAHIAAAASNVNGIIYIIGGYSVAPNGNEVSSNKVHRYNPITNSYLSDGVNIPIAIDDHVQAIYNDSLIYIATGWSNSTNVNNVQIYDTYNNSWQTGVTVPGYFDRVFGSTGTIIGDTIYYFGGANLGSNFPVSNRLRKGYIDPSNPRFITWSWSIPSPLVNAYRPACTSFKNRPIWIGGSSVSYNYDGIAYNGSGGVVPTNKVIEYSNSQINDLTPQNSLIPMDLRGVASISDSIKFIVGGMIANQQVSNKTLRLKIDLTTDIKTIKWNEEYYLYPNPNLGSFKLDLGNGFLLNTEVTIRDIQGNVKGLIMPEGQIVELNLGLSSGLYFVEIINGKDKVTKKLIIK